MSREYCAFLTAETVTGCAQRSWSAGGKSQPDTVCIKLTGTDQAAEMLLLPCCYTFQVFSQHFFPPAPRAWQVTASS